MKMSVEEFMATYPERIPETGDPNRVAVLTTWAKNKLASYCRCWACDDILLPNTPNWTREEVKPQRPVVLCELCFDYLHGAPPLPEMSI